LFSITGAVVLANVNPAPLGPQVRCVGVDLEGVVVRCG
jgi:hypothetical protein